MRIALTVARFDESISYWEQAVLPFLAQRADVHIITSTSPIRGIRDKAYPEGRSRWKGADIHRIRPLLGARGRIYAPRIRTLIQEIRPDRLIASAPSQIFSLPAIAWCRANGIPFTYVSGENRLQSPRSPVLGLASGAYWDVVLPQLLRYATRGADRIVAYTTDTESMLRKVDCKARIDLVPLPVDVSQFSFAHEARELERAARGWASSQVTMFCGKFNDSKDIYGLTQAWRRVVGQEANQKLILVGATTAPSVVEQCDRIAAFGDSRIEVLPFQEQDVVAALYCAADLVVFPLPSVGIQQALATGASVLIAEGSTVDHIQQYVAPGQLVHYPAGGLSQGLSEALSGASLMTLPARMQRAREAQSLGVGPFISTLVPGLVVA